MVNRYVVLIALLVVCPFAGFGQIGANVKVDDWRAVAVGQHQRGKWLIGAGPTLLGATAKAGHFVANGLWVGVQSEVHALLSNRAEAGVFGRYYLWNGGLVSGFSEIGVSYGAFQSWGGFDIDNELPPPARYRTTKLNAALGLEYPLGRRVTLEGVAKAGRLTSVNWIQPSLQLSANVYLGR